MLLAFSVYNLITDDRCFIHNLPRNEPRLKRPLLSRVLSLSALIGISPKDINIDTCDNHTSANIDINLSKYYLIP